MLKSNKKCTVLRETSKSTSAQIFDVTFLGLLASEMEREYAGLVSFHLSHFISQIRVKIPGDTISLFVAARDIAEDNCPLFLLRNTYFFSSQYKAKKIKLPRHPCTTEMLKAMATACFLWRLLHL